MRPSQRQVRAFASFQPQPKAGDQFINRQQNRTETNTLRHVLTHLSDGHRAGDGQLRCPIPLPANGQLRLGPGEARGLPPASPSAPFPIQTPQIPSGVTACPPRLARLPTCLR